MERFRERGYIEEWRQCYSCYWHVYTIFDDVALSLFFPPLYLFRSLHGSHFSASSNPADMLSFPLYCMFCTRLDGWLNLMAAVVVRT